jgi:uncharacterized protein (TIGR03435 family)
VFGIVRPVLLWPGGMSTRLDDSQIEAILAHELSHVRRYDNLTAALHMIVQATFWFHPLVWWLGSRLVAERERACDEAVVQLGSDPETYAESILKTCEFQIESPLVCVAGVTGADLTRRIEQIMENRVTRFLTFRRKMLLAAAGATLIFVPVFAGTLQGQPKTTIVASTTRVAPPTVGKTLYRFSLMDAVRGLVAQGKALDAPPYAGARFEVASIKPFKSDNGMMQMQLGVQLSRFTSSGMPLRQLMMFAYGVQPFQIEGGPNWLTTERFEITAKIPDAYVNAPVRPDVMGPVNYMMQALLADRFRLVIERSTKEAPVYELQLARSDRKPGPKLTVSKTDCAEIMAKARAGGAPPPPPLPGEPPQCALFMSPGSMGGGSLTMASLARALSNRLGRPVIDKTGLEGNYDFSFDFAPDFGAGPGGGPPTPPPGAPQLPPVDPNAPNIITALQEQLGLKVEAKRGPVDTIVIKSVELPTPD